LEPRGFLKNRDEKMFDISGIEKLDIDQEIHFYALRSFNMAHFQRVL